MKRDYDVVVVGAGGAGMAAAIMASDAGASVIVLEADDRIGGSTSLSGGVFYAAGTSVHRAARGMVSVSASGRVQPSSGTTTACSSSLRVSTGISRCTPLAGCYS